MFVKYAGILAAYGPTPPQRRAAMVFGVPQKAAYTCFWTRDGLDGSIVAVTLAAAIRTETDEARVQEGVCQGIVARAFVERPKARSKQISGKS